MAKKFDYGKDIYYFNIRNGGHSSITIKRKDKNDAINRFISYKKLGKDCEWLGKWDGKKFQESAQPKEKVA
ncbi:MAG: hypothetical protein V3V14_02320 [Saprospiraceae bacterium]